MATRKSQGGKPPHKSFVTCIPFRDHRDQDAVHAHACSSVLPPLWAFQVYVTFHDSLSGLTDVAESLSEVRYETRSVHGVRFDIYPLPGADVDSCMAHYNAEKDARENSRLRVLGIRYDNIYIRRKGFILIDSPGWESQGVKFVEFDIDPQTREDPDPDPTEDFEDVYVISGLELKEPKYASLENKFDVNGMLKLPGPLLPRLLDSYAMCAECYELKEEYDEAVNEGKAVWD